MTERDKSAEHGRPTEGAAAPPADARKAADTLGQDHAETAGSESGNSDLDRPETTHTPRNPGGISSGLQPGGTVPGGGPGGSVGSIGTGGGSTGGAPTGSAKRRI